MECAFGDIDTGVRCVRKEEKNNTI
jgi:hypothetical protein